MTPEQIEAERAAFESWVRSKSGFVSFDPEFDCDWKRDMWSGWLARAARHHLEKIGVKFVPMDKKRAEFDRLVEECRREENEE